MNKAIILSGLIASSSLITLPAHAEMHTQHKQEAVFASSTIVGAVAAGPVGWLVGAIGGGWMANQIGKADQLDTSQQEVAQLRREMARLEQENEEFAQLALNQLQLEMLFKTGDSALSAAGTNRLALMSDFLQNNPEVNIRLDGYADPRGSEGFNMALSTARAHAVAEKLQEFNVAKERISVYSHGDRRSTAPEGDLDAYALERVVRIELSNANNNESLAHVDIVQ